MEKDEKRGDERGIGRWEREKSERREGKREGEGYGA